MVNTFMPYADFRRVARALDKKRLGKQRVEAMQIINILDGSTKKKGFSYHPVVAMWREHLDALRYYYNCMVKEWVRRGFKNTMKFYEVPKKIKVPWFAKSRALQMTHRASLLRKEPAYYSSIFTGVPKKYMRYSYIWPSKLTKEQARKLREYARKSQKEQEKYEETLDIAEYAELYEATAAAKALKKKDQGSDKKVK